MRDLFGIQLFQDFEHLDYIKTLIEYTNDGVTYASGVMPNQIPDLKGIEGDSSDNIPGVRGVSSAAAPLLNEYRTLGGIYQAIDDCNDDFKEEKKLAAFWKTNLGIKRNPMNAFKTYRKDALLSKDLATIRTYCFNTAKDFAPEDPRNLKSHPVSTIDIKKFNDRLGKLEIRSARLPELH